MPFSSLLSPSPSRRKCRVNRRLWGPLLISVAPPCAGTSTFLASLHESVHRINNSSDNNISAQSQSHSLSSSEQEEKELLLQLLRGEADYASFCERLAALLDGDTRLVRLVSGTMRNVLQNLAGERNRVNAIATSATEVIHYSAEAVLEEAQHVLKHSPGVVCYEAKSFSPDAYRQVLWLAVKYRRVVRFLRWGQELPKVSLVELYRRNVVEMISSGKYTPCKTLAQLYDQAEDFLMQDQPYSRMLTHVDLANLAGFQMDRKGLVFPVGISFPTNQSPVDNNYPWKAWTNHGSVFCLRSDAPSKRTVRFYIEEEEHAMPSPTHDMASQESISTELCSHSVPVNTHPTGKLTLQVPSPPSHAVKNPLREKLTLSLVSPTQESLESVDLYVSSQSEDGEEKFHHGVVKKSSSENVVNEKPRQSIHRSLSGSAECAIS